MRAVQSGLEGTGAQGRAETCNEEEIFSMNKFIQTCLGALALMATAGWAGDAHAEQGWRFSRITGINARAAAADDTTVFVLDGSDFTAASGFRIRTFDADGSGRWRPPTATDGRGTSLAMDSQTRIVYTVSLDNHVWSKRTSDTGWSRFPRTKCEGGDLTPRQIVGQNNVSSYNHNTYVISGTRVYYWQNATCWVRLPALPSGSPVEIAQAAQDPTQVWALNGNMQIFRWDGAWRSMAPGIGLGLGYERVVGSDGASVWQWNASTGFTRLSSWTFGSIEQIQRSIQSNGYTVVRPNGELWWHGFHDN
jgi:hypothetical protein